MKQREPISPIPLFLTIGGGLLLIAAAILLATRNASSLPTSAAPFEEETYPEILRVSLSPAQKPRSMRNQPSSWMFDPPKPTRADTSQAQSTSHWLSWQRGWGSSTPISGPSPTVPDPARNRAPVRRPFCLKTDLPTSPPSSAVSKLG